MKSIQVIDGARNAAYDIYAATGEEFELIFPNGQEIEFIEDFISRVGEEVADKTIAPLWSRPVPKKTVRGIHGTLFYELALKKQYYPNKMDRDLGNGRPAVAAKALTALDQAQRHKRHEKD